MGPTAAYPSMQPGCRGVSGHEPFSPLHVDNNTRPDSMGAFFEFALIRTIDARAGLSAKRHSRRDLLR
ncbi:hypothetical protein JTE90_021618 [Oedothorax gibbosus]|uniref:Uncharacterized protein n=1 Tax=Oedothorax gibbosus TaxID=931172 RepID=A0AAV6VQ77_9ARAC|nr:hypothetical protein JTE90_021618 [Oedothorax gibbosus]